MSEATCGHCETRYHLDAESAEPTCPRCARPLRLLRHSEVDHRPHLQGHLVPHSLRPREE